MSDCIFKAHSLPVMLKQGIKTPQDTWKLLGMGDSPLQRERLHLFSFKSLNETERGAGSRGDQSYFAWKNSSLQVLPSQLEY